MAWYKFWAKSKKHDYFSDNKHSKVIYLMGPDNKFLQFFDIDTEPNELADLIADEISYDVGIRHLGTGKRPVRVE